MSAKQEKASMTTLFKTRKLKVNTEKQPNELKMHKINI